MDLRGYPGPEDYSEVAMENIQAFVSAAYRMLGLSWQHPRILLYLERVEQATNAELEQKAAGQGREHTPCQVRSRHQLPFVYYQKLAIHLAGLVLDERAAIQDAIAKQQAKKLLTEFSNQKQLEVNCK